MGKGSGLSPEGKVDGESSAKWTWAQNPRPPQRGIACLWTYLVHTSKGSPVGPRQPQLLLQLNRDNLWVLKDLLEQKLSLSTLFFRKDVPGL